MEERPELEDVDLRVVTIYGSDTLKMYVVAQCGEKEKAINKAGTDSRITPALTQQVEEGGLLGDRERIIRNTQEIFRVSYYRIEESRGPKVGKASPK